MRKVKYQLVKVPVSHAGVQVKFSAETDKLYDRVMGLFISTPSYRHHYGSTLEMKIAEEEIFPEGFETKLLASSLSVNPNQRFVRFDEDENLAAKGNLISGRYTDGGLDSGVSYPYTVILYFKLKKEPQAV
jgi:hypothetical protein